MSDDIGHDGFRKPGTYPPYLPNNAAAENARLTAALAAAEEERGHVKALLVNEVARIEKIEAALAAAEEEEVAYIGIIQEERRRAERAEAALVASEEECLHLAERILHQGDVALAATKALATARNDALEECANKAREWADHYTPGSDGRNTFVLFAEWAEALKAASVSSAEERTSAAIERIAIRFCHMNEPNYRFLTTWDAISFETPEQAKRWLEMAGLAYTMATGREPCDT